MWTYNRTGKIYLHLATFMQILFEIRLKSSLIFCRYLTKCPIIPSSRLPYILVHTRTSLWCCHNLRRSGKGRSAGSLRRSIQGDRFHCSRVQPSQLCSYILQTMDGN